MPRKARIDAPGALQHVILLGIERRNIFWDNADRINFLDRLGRILKEISTLLGIAQPTVSQSVRKGEKIVSERKFEIEEL